MFASCLAALAAGCAAAPGPGVLGPRVHCGDLLEAHPVLASDEFRPPPGHGPAKRRRCRTRGGPYRSRSRSSKLTTIPEETLRVGGNRAVRRSRCATADDALLLDESASCRRIGLESSETRVVGYGIVEPALDWNDYGRRRHEGQDRRHPGQRPGLRTNDPALFKGRR